MYMALGTSWAVMLLRSRARASSLASRRSGTFAVVLIRRCARGLSLVSLPLIPSLDPAAVVLLTNSPDTMLDMKEWSEMLQTARHQASYERCVPRPIPEKMVD